MLDFLKQFILNPKETGALFPTGEKLSDLITDLAELKTAKTIVEFGPGTGVFTKKILEKIDSRSTFISIEKNPVFFQNTKELFPNIKIYNDTASNIKNILNENKLENCDRIVSGLPFAAFDENIQKDILNAAYSSLSPDGIFVTFSYIHSQFLPSGIKFKKLLQKTFKNVSKSKIIWKNIPPAFVYRCIK